MNNTIKNIIKYLVVFAIIGTVVYFGIKLIFPEPNPLQAYNNNLELAEIETYDEMLDSTNQLIMLSNPYLLETSFNIENYNELLYAKNTLMSLDYVNNFIIDDLAFAKNTTIYNSNVKKTTNSLGKIKETYSRVNTYLTNNLNPFLEQNSATMNSVNLYINAMLPFYADLCKDYQTYTSANIQIVEQLDTTIRNNPWSQTVLNIINEWTNNLITKLNNNETVFTSQIDNAGACLVFVANNISQAKFVSYYSDYQNLNTKITEINSVSVENATNVVLTATETTYTDSIEDASLKALTINFMSFLKGEN